MAEIYFQHAKRPLVRARRENKWRMSASLTEIRGFTFNGPANGKRHPIARFDGRNVILCATDTRGNSVATCYTESDLRELVRTLQNPNTVRLETLQEEQVTRDKALAAPMTKDHLVVTVRFDHKRQHYSGAITFDGRRVIVVIDRDDTPEVLAGEPHLCRFIREIESNGSLVWLAKLVKPLNDKSEEIAALQAKIASGRP